MYLTHNEVKYDVAQRFCKILINKIFEYMTSISRNEYVNKLDDIVKKYKNTYHRIIKIKLGINKVKHMY